MTIPLELVISGSVSVLLLLLMLLLMLWLKAHRVGYLEGQLAAAEKRYEALYQRYNREHGEWARGFYSRPQAKRGTGGAIVQADMLAKCDDCKAEGVLMGPCVIIDHQGDCGWVAENRGNWPADGRCKRGHQWCTCSAPVGSWKAAP